MTNTVVRCSAMVGMSYRIRAASRLTGTASAIERRRLDAIAEKELLGPRKLLDRRH
jgi:hypothetical protein